MTPAPSPQMNALIDIALVAGEAIMKIYQGPIAAREKADRSPVTEADEAADAIIIAGLRNHFPDIGIVTEETAATSIALASSQRFFLVDPLDGTKEFISGNGEFTVNIALIENGIALQGVVYAPAVSQLYSGCLGEGAAKSTNHGKSWTSINARSAPHGGLTVLASRSHMDVDTQQFLALQNVRELVQSGSSLKFCRVAEGVADLYPRFGRTMEWDTAAGQAVLEAAGGKVLDRDGAPLRYGKLARGLDNPGFIAYGR